MTPKKVKVYVDLCKTNLLVMFTNFYYRIFVNSVNNAAHKKL